MLSQRHALLPRLAARACRAKVSRDAPPRAPRSRHVASAAGDDPGNPLRAIEVADENQRRDLAVVLVTPQIPGNTGTIARTCAATRVPLHLVGPLGFSLEDSQLKRAGLDYWCVPFVDTPRPPTRPASAEPPSPRRANPPRLPQTTRGSSLRSSTHAPSPDPRPRSRRNSVCVKVHDDWDAFYSYWREELGSPGRLVAFSKFGARPHAEEGAYEPGDWLLFGAETTGLPDAAHDACAATGGVRRIPIDEAHVRSLNLAVSAGIGVYEALRQIDGPPEHFPPRDDAPGSGGVAE